MRLFAKGCRHQAMQHCLAVGPKMFVACLERHKTSISIGWGGIYCDPQKRIVVTVVYYLGCSPTSDVLT